MPDTQEPTEAERVSQPTAINSSTSSLRTPLRLNRAAYHGLAGDVVELIEPTSEADPVGLLMHFLTMFGNAVGDGLYVRLGPDKHPGRLFTVIVGDAALGRKGTAGSEIKRLMQEVDRKWFREALVSGMQSAESIVSAVDDSNGQSDLMLYYSELGDLLSAMKKRHEIAEKLKQAYDGDVLTVRTKNRSGWLTASHANISLIGHITPAVLSDRLSETDIVSGLASRLLFIGVEKSKTISRPEPVSDEDLEALAEKIDDVLAWVNDFSYDGVDPVSAAMYRMYGRHPKREMHLSDAALDYWDTLYVELSSKRTGVVNELAARAPSNVRRLALIYAILDKSPIIDVVHLKAAKAVFDYSEASAIEIFEGITGDYRVDRILFELSVAPENRLTQSEIHAMFGRHLSASRLKVIINSLLETGMVKQGRETPTSGRGRKITTYTLLRTDDP